MQAREVPVLDAAIRNFSGVASIHTMKYMPTAEKAKTTRSSSNDITSGTIIPVT